MSALAHHAPAARQLLWWPQPALDALAISLHESLSAWQLDWGANGTSAHVACPASATHARGAPTGWRALGDGASWKLAKGDGAEASVECVLVEALFGPESDGARDASAPGGIAAAVVPAAWEALWIVLRKALKLHDAPAPSLAGAQHASRAAAWLEPWSGAAIVTIRLGSGSLRILLAPDTAARVLSTKPTLRPARPDGASRPAMTPVWEAASSAATQLHVQMHPVEVSLGALASLRVGDVIELPHILREPVLAVAAPATPLFKAFLGMRSGRRALEWLAPAAETTPKAHEGTPR